MNFIITFNLLRNKQHLNWVCKQVLIISHIFCTGQDLHGNGDEQHVQALKDDVATVADPDVVAEDHSEESAGLQGRERSQSRLPPASPVRRREPDAVRRRGACRAQ